MATPRKLSTKTLSNYRMAAPLVLLAFDCSGAEPSNASNSNGGTASGGGSINGNSSGGISGTGGPGVGGTTAGTGGVSTGGYVSTVASAGGQSSAPGGAATGGRSSSVATGGTAVATGGTAGTAGASAIMNCTAGASCLIAGVTCVNSSNVTCLCVGPAGGSYLTCDTAGTGGATSTGGAGNTGASPTTTGGAASLGGSRATGGSSSTGGTSANGGQVQRGECPVRPVRERRLILPAMAIIKSPSMQASADRLGIGSTKKVWHRITPISFYPRRSDATSRTLCGKATIRRVSSTFASMASSTTTSACIRKTLREILFTTGHASTKSTMPLPEQVCDPSSRSASCLRHLPRVRILYTGTTAYPRISRRPRTGPNGRTSWQPSCSTWKVATESMRFATTGSSRFGTKRRGCTRSAMPGTTNSTHTPSRDC